MKFAVALTSSVALLLAGATNALPQEPTFEENAAAVLADGLIRALPNAPDGYVPITGSCPSTLPTVRLANGLSSGEMSFLSARRPQAISSMQTLLNRLNISGFDSNSYFSAHQNNQSALPNIAIAASGGGYRALLNGAGAIKAFDSRETGTTGAGQLGGLLQSATYVAGLSGGSWLVGTIYVNNFTTISALQASDDVWEFQNSIFEGPPSGGIQLLSTADYFRTIYDEVQAKTKNYETTITDYWSRALSFQLYNATDGGPSLTWSSISEQPGFSTGDYPFPIVVADSRPPGTLLVPENTTIYEFNPYEFGTFDPTTYGFVPLEYLGSNFSNGNLINTSACVRGYDNAGYIIGTSSTLFNQFFLQSSAYDQSLPSFIQTAIQDVLGGITQADEDIAAYEPNPFLNWNPTGMAPSASAQELTLVDGGEDNQNIPLQPLIQPVREVDVIFAIDSSADTSNNWPNGSSLVQTYERSLNPRGIANNTAFPSIPDVNTFINLGLNSRPTFFGCNPANNTANNASASPPLIVYLPNAPYSYFSNVSTFDLSYPTDQRDEVVTNGANVATQGNGTRNSDWDTCVGCAILARSFNRTATALPDACNACFSKYCWDGTLNATTPATYAPSLIVAGASATGGGANGGSGTSGSPAAAFTSGKSDASQGMTFSPLLGSLSALAAFAVALF